MSLPTSSELTMSHSIEKVAKRNFSLFVVRKKNSGELGCSRPCKECGKWITCARLLGLNLDVFHLDEDGIMIPHDGNCCKYKAYETAW